MIAVIDYGLGNLRSVSKALESLGVKAEVTSDSKTIPIVLLLLTMKLLWDYNYNKTEV